MHLKLPDNNEKIHYVRNTLSCMNSMSQTLDTWLNKYHFDPSLISRHAPRSNGSGLPPYISKRFLGWIQPQNRHTSEGSLIKLRNISDPTFYTRIPHRPGPLFKVNTHLANIWPTSHHITIISHPS